MRSLRARRWLIISSTAVGTLLIAALLALFVLYPYLAERAIRDRLVPRLEARLGQPVEIAEVEVSLGGAVLRGISVGGSEGGDHARLLEVPELSMAFDVGASFLGRIELDEVIVRELHVRVPIAADGSSPWDQALAWLRRKRSGGGGGGGPRLMPRRVIVEGATVVVEHRSFSLTARSIAGAMAEGELAVESGSLELSSRFGPRAELSGVGFRGRTADLAKTAEVTVANGELTLWPKMRLTGISGTVRPGEASRQLWVDLGGSWGGDTGRLWKARGHLDPIARTGNLEVAAERFKLDRLSSVLVDSPIRDFADTAIGVGISIASDGRQVSVEGEIEVSGLNVFHPKLAGEVIEDVSFAGDLTATYDLEARELALERAVLRSGGAEYQLNAGLRLGDERLLEALQVRLVIPPIECQAMLDSIPSQLVPRLQGFRLKGTFETDVAVRIGWDDLEATILDGFVGIRRCKVLRATSEMRAEKIEGQFKHRVIMDYEDGEPIYETITIGPSNPGYVPLEEVSPYLMKSLMTTEDSSFYRHRGFIVSEFRTALIKNLEAGYFRYGASSITMQLVKNVYLDREKTLSRKLQELFMTWYVETKVDKERLMEVYVNAIEYGPGLYGIGPAARVYFGKEPADLNPVEAAFFSSILPAPRRRFVQYCRDRLNRWSDRKIQRILELMHKRERLTEDEYMQAAATPLVFRPDKKGCRGRRARSRR
jgi:hypothetical protein